MNKIFELVKKIEKLESEILTEEKNILKIANLELQSKSNNSDEKTLAIQKKIVDKQENDFHSFNLARQRSIKKLDDILEELIGRGFTNSDSEHWLLFSAISCSERKASRILEIGTADGITTAILASLFPESEIVSIDLPRTDNEFKNSYNRKNVVNQVVENRNNLLNKFENITFIETNSVKLFNWAEKSFDIIWVDGAHGYPVLPLDLNNAIRLIRENGVVIVDDVFIRLRKTDKIYRSTAAIETLKLFKENNLITNFTLFRKRLSLHYNFKDLNEKFLGFVQC